MGLRNILLKNFNALNDRTDAGSLFENSIFSELIKNIGILDELYFWRTQSKNEVDFILKKDNFYPIEVKYNINIRFKITSGIKYFSEDYNCNKAFIAIAGNFELKKINGIKVYFIPAWLI